MAHYCCPQTMTPEALAKWIQDNALDKNVHVERIDLDEETVHELERQSSLASRAIDRLEKVKEEFMGYFKDGTPTSAPESPLDEPQHQPVSITIPPTKGLKALKANREYADTQLENGYKEENIEYYLIPFPEDSMIFAVDITGEVVADGLYNREMTIEEINNTKPILKKEKKKKNQPEEQAELALDGPDDDMEDVSLDDI